MRNKMHIRIKERRLQLSLTQEALAKMLSVSRVSITKWETRVTEPDGENLQALAKVLEVSPEWLLYGGNSSEADALIITRKTVNIKKIPIITLEQAADWKARYDTLRLSDIQHWCCATVPVSEQAYGLIYQGESMTNPYSLPSIPKGSTVIIEPSFKNKIELYGKIIIAKNIITNDIVIKKFIHEPPQFYLISLNTAFTPILFTNDYQIIGYVIQIIQTL
ncbi:helix-turn-helix domain-containing protein [Proteus mirabilis]|nr:helix-turn-helix domain-containing protein [Proteus mirabilis]AVB30048.1 phage repressor protein [Proteus mirabilis]AWR58769.1 phage repressor protein [Proteus mirabilis]EKT8676340.1 helix-turn-helix domain-containing protein [Proteus mirabilis]EKU2371374.1 helix-turn-helix domain-containing protein [Proteus mirabilis]EKU7918951.1 helix-turn-helix domain-containing protein [Proteus mirabilis]